MSRPSTLANIKHLATKIIPQGGSLWLYGSRARGDYHEGSDWDLLILLDKDKQTWEDFDRYVYPFTELGMNIDERINPLLYTKKEWNERHFTPFYHNVQNDKIVLV